MGAGRHRVSMGPVFNSTCGVSTRSFPSVGETYVDKALVLTFCDLFLMTQAEIIAPV